MGHFITYRPVIYNEPTYKPYKSQSLTFFSINAWSQLECTKSGAVRYSAVVHSMDLKDFFLWESLRHFQCLPPGKKAFSGIYRNYILT